MGYFGTIPPETIRAMPSPPESVRIPVPPNSFGEWLRDVRLKKDKTVYLYNGAKKANQSAQVAVLDIPVGTQDLQQCADAIIRLRTEYLLSAGVEDKIKFHATDGTLLDYRSWKQGYRWKLQSTLIKQQTANSSDSRVSFEQYLEFVFRYCGTSSLQKELQPVALTDILPGDVLIHGGFPGHAVIVMDVVIAKDNHRNFLLAQSYMPAQDIHVLKNPIMPGEQPWYGIPEGSELYTPEWVFAVGECRRFVD